MPFPFPAPERFLRPDDEIGIGPMVPERDTIELELRWPDGARRRWYRSGRVEFIEGGRHG
jgi:hypothetical protein